MLVKEARAIAGSLGRPSKMPGRAYGIPARFCPIGSRLVKIKGSVCSKCYALKGRYVFKNVLDAQQKRFNSLTDPRWIEAMVTLIRRKKSVPYFRWHDSGDIQGLWHLENIACVAMMCPDTQFWIPTREKRFVHQYLDDHGAFPPNLVVRVSGAMIDGKPPAAFPNTSTVVSKGEPTCPAPKQEGRCGPCRRCWDPAVGNVSYLQH